MGIPYGPNLHTRRTHTQDLSNMNTEVRTESKNLTQIIFEELRTFIAVELSKFASAVHWYKSNATKRARTKQKSFRWSLESFT